MFHNEVSETRRCMFKNELELRNKCCPEKGCHGRNHEASKSVSDATTSVRSANMNPLLGK